MSIHTPRRAFLQGLAATPAGLASAKRGADKGRPQEAPPASHAEVVSCGHLSALFGDSTIHGVGPGYCGIWSLTSLHQGHSAFVSSFAGFIFNTFRGMPAELRRLGEHQVEYRLETAAMTSRALFTVREPCYIDCETTIIPHERISQPYLLQSWASYINSPEDGDIFFRHDDKWIRAHSPKHGVDATYCPSSLKDIEQDLGHVAPEDRKKKFIYGYSAQRFSEPFYYGRIRNMVLAFFFDNTADIRFTISPNGGGASILPGKTCPAWDWLWLVPKPQQGRPYTLRARMVYKPFENPDDIFAEYRRWS